MPQELRVLCCIKCKMFQVDIVKKANKWQCKLCQEKQSVFKEFFRGTGAECRLKVQELNLNTHTQTIEIENKFLSLLDRDDLDIDLETIVSENNKKCNNGQLKIEDSKWMKYVDSPQPLKQNIIETRETDNKLKRKSTSTSRTTQSNCAKNPRSLTQSNSKWNKYL